MTGLKYDITGKVINALGKSKDWDVSKLGALRVLAYSDLRLFYDLGDEDIVVWADWKHVDLDEWETFELTPWYILGNFRGGFRILVHCHIPLIIAYLEYEPAISSLSLDNAVEVIYVDSFLDQSFSIDLSRISDMLQKSSTQSLWSTTEDDTFHQEKFSIYELWWSSLRVPYVDHPKCNLRNIFESLDQVFWSNQNGYTLAEKIKGLVQEIEMFYDFDDSGDHGGNWIWLKRDQVVVAYLSLRSPLAFVLSSEREIEDIFKSAPINTISCKNFSDCAYAYDFAKRQDAGSHKLPLWLSGYLEKRTFFSVTELFSGTFNMDRAESY